MDVDRLKQCVFRHSRFSYLIEIIREIRLKNEDWHARYPILAIEHAVIDARYQLLLNVPLLLSIRIREI